MVKEGDPNSASGRYVEDQVGGVCSSGNLEEGSEGKLSSRLYPVSVALQYGCKDKRDRRN